jgi:SAM-dependent methyltransferase
VDINPDFVAIASERTGLRIQLGSMERLAELSDSFDAVTCMFSSIGYTTDLPAAIAAMASHLNPNGVLIVEPWITPEAWMPGGVQVLDHESGGIRIVRMSHSSTAGDKSILDMHYLVGSASGVDYFSERHQLTLFTVDEYEAAFNSAGMTFEVDQPGPFGRGALIGMPR